ncbi:hypothetical protein B0H14DRAFT_2998919 [Mycena olivaceomarginata]|nr:hypothetical protein B0H14DRAFT_2998919 [Mycena olivaceomarginata]
MSLHYIFAVVLGALKPLHAVFPESQVTPFRCSSPVFQASQAVKPLSSMLCLLSLFSCHCRLDATVSRNWTKWRRSSMRHCTRFVTFLGIHPPRVLADE